MRTKKCQKTQIQSLITQFFKDIKKWLFIFPKSSSSQNKQIFVSAKRCAYYGKYAYFGYAYYEWGQYINGNWETAQRYSRKENRQKIQIWDEIHYSESNLNPVFEVTGQKMFCAYKHSFIVKLLKIITRLQLFNEISSV